MHQIGFKVLFVKDDLKCSNLEGPKLLHLGSVHQTVQTQNFHGAFSPGLCRLGIQTLEEKWFSAPLVPIQRSLVESQLLVGAGKAYIHHSVLKQAAHFASLISQLNFHESKLCWTRTQRPPLMSLLKKNGVI